MKVVIFQIITHDFNGQQLMINYGPIIITLPSGNVLQFAIENGPVEIVRFPINSMVIFHSYVNVYQRVMINYGNLCSVDFQKLMSNYQRLMGW